MNEKEKELTSLFVRTFPFWGKLSDVDRETMCRTAHQVHFKKGTNIHDGNECTGVILVKTGSLRLYILSEDGKEITLYRIFPGEMCMLSASCVLETITFDVFVMVNLFVCNRSCLGGFILSIAKRLAQVRGEFREIHKLAKFFPSFRLILANHSPSVIQSRVNLSLCLRL